MLPVLALEPVVVVMLMAYLEPCCYRGASFEYCAAGSGGGEAAGCCHGDASCEYCAASGGNSCFCEFFCQPLLDTPATAMFAGTTGTRMSHS